jgi:uncharacterized membrane protein
MSSAKAGILIGEVLALVWFLLGFWAFFFVAIAMSLGALIGRIVDGKLNVRSLIDAVRGKRTSS